MYKTLPPQQAVGALWYFAAVDTTKFTSHRSTHGKIRRSISLSLCKCLQSRMITSNERFSSCTSIELSGGNPAGNRSSLRIIDVRPYLFFTGSHFFHDCELKATSCLPYRATFSLHHELVKATYMHILTAHRKQPVIESMLTSLSLPKPDSFSAMRAHGERLFSPRIPNDTNCSCHTTYTLMYQTLLWPGLSALHLHFR